MSTDRYWTPLKAKVCAMMLLLIIIVAGVGIAQQAPAQGYALTSVRNTGKTTLRVVLDNKTYAYISPGQQRWGVSRIAPAAGTRIKVTPGPTVSYPVEYILPLNFYSAYRTR
jgi:hypothetical protein